MNDIDITLYLNAYRVRALADALGNQTAETVEDKLTEAFDTLYQEYVPDEQRASIHLYCAFVLSTSCDLCCHSRGASTCSARHRYSASTFPHPCAYGAVGHDLCKLDVATLGKGCIVLHLAAIACNVYGVDVVDKGHEMGVAHRYERASELAEGGRQFAKTAFVILFRHMQTRFKHVYRDAFHRAAGCEVQP